MRPNKLRQLLKSRGADLRKGSRTLICFLATHLRA
jgi:hypothetical protein